MTSSATVVRADEQMPICSDGHRLVFVNDALMIIDFSSSQSNIRITSFEETGRSWDGASIPKWAQFIIGRPFLRRYRWASYWHDRLCESAQSIEDRTFADALFLKLLKEANVVKPLRLAMWLAVRLYGLTVWRVKQWRFEVLKASANRS